MVRPLRGRTRTTTSAAPKAPCGPSLCVSATLCETAPPPSSILSSISSSSISFSSFSFSSFSMAPRLLDREASTHSGHLNDQEM